MFEVGVRGTFEAAHRLSGDFGPATRTHGHTYQVEVNVRGEEIGGEGTLVDVGLLRRLLDDALARLHYQDLDTLDVFGGRNTTAEVVAQHLFETLRPGLASADRVTSMRVVVWESAAVYAAFQGPIRSAGGGR